MIQRALLVFLAGVCGVATVWYFINAAGRDAMWWDVIGFLFYGTLAIMFTIFAILHHPQRPHPQCSKPDATDEKEDSDSE